MTNQEKALKMHEEWNGKLETIAKSHVKTREDLAIAYTPGVAEPCKVIAEDKEAASPGWYIYTGHRGVARAKFILLIANSLDQKVVVNWDKTE